MPRKRLSHTHLPQHVYIRRGKYQLRYKDGHTKLFISLDVVLSEWQDEYGPSDRIKAITDDYKIKILPDLAQRTRKDYEAAIGRLMPVFGNMRLKDLRPVHVYRFQDARVAEGANVQCNRDIAVLSAICSHGIRLGYADYNVCREVRRRPEKPRERYVRNDELFIVYNLAPEYVQDAISLTCLTGIRLGDIMRISENNIQPDGFLFRQGKTGKWVLVEWDPVLRSVAVKPPVSYSGFQTAWQRLMQKSLKMGLTERFTFHDLRAKAGSETDDWRLLGHTDRKTFERIYNRKPVQVRSLLSEKRQKQ